VDTAKLMRDLGSADPAVRLKASKQLESELRKPELDSAFATELE